MTDSISTPESSNIAGATYDEAARMLEIEFNDGDTWNYSGVSRETWDAFKSSPSKGSFFHRAIKGRHNGVKA